MTYSSVPQMWVYPPMLLADFNGATSVCTAVPAAFPASAIIAAPMPGWYPEPSTSPPMQTPVNSPEAAVTQPAATGTEALAFFPQEHPRVEDDTERDSSAPVAKKSTRKRRARRRQAVGILKAKEEGAQPLSESVSGFCLQEKLGVVSGPPGLSPRHEQQPENARLTALLQASEVLDVEQLPGNQELCAEVTKRLNNCSRNAVNAERDAIMKCLLPATRTLAFDRAGCRVVQMAISVGNAVERDQLVEKLRGTVLDQFLSPCANHVLNRIVEVMPAARLSFLQQELSGHVLDAARHQYGCRVLERLIEHWNSDELAWLVNEVLPAAEELCRHKYGNFVMQHLFEHGPRDCKAKIGERVIAFLPKLAKHRTASHVIQKALLFSDEDTQYSLVQALLQAQHEDSIVDVACARYGIYVLEELATVKVCNAEVRKSLLAGLDRLKESQFGQRAVSKFGLEA